MARIGTGQSSGNLYAVLVAGLAGVLFFGILMWPGGSGDSRRVAALEATPLSTTLDDPVTHRYLAALERIKPALAKRLQNLLRHPERLSEAAAAARTLGRPDAAKALADLVERIAPPKRAGGDSSGARPIQFPGIRRVAA